MKTAFENGMYVCSAKYKGRRILAYAPYRLEAMAYAAKLMAEYQAKLDR